MLTAVWSSASSATTPTTKWTSSETITAFSLTSESAPGSAGLQQIWCTLLIGYYMHVQTHRDATAHTSLHILQEKLLKHACIEVVQCRDPGICRVWVLTCLKHKFSGCYLMSWNKNAILTVCIIMCMHRYTHKHTLSGRKDAHECTNTHNRKSVNEWEGAGRLAGAVLVEDRASVHLSISKHSQLSSLSTGGEVIPFFFSPLHHRPLSSPHFCFPPLLQPFLLSHLSTLHLSFYILPP